MSTKPPSKVVFVGNIPYGLSEEQITDIFTSAGKVINLRLVYDHQTGRPKGFGFIEYPDTDSSASAVRNLNDYEVMGRKLRVDYSSEGRVDAGDDSSAPSHTNPSNATNGDHSAVAGSLPTLPPGKELPPGVSASDAISRTLATLPPAQLLDILSSMKSFASTDPARATELLQQAPQLSYAVFQALLLLGLVSPEAIHSVADTSAVPPPPQVQSGYVPPPAVYPATNTPPVAAPYAPPTAVPAYAAAPQAAPAPAPSGGMENDALMQAVLQLRQEDIDKLEPAERAQIMALRAQFLGQGR